MKTFYKITLILLIVGHYPLYTSGQSTNSIGPVSIFPEIDFSLSALSGGEGNMVPGLRAGLGINKPFTANLSFESGLLLAQKGGKSVDGDFETKLKLTYIDVPLLVEYGHNDVLSFYGGIQPSFLISAKEKYEGPGISESRTVVEDYKKFDLAASLGVKYRIGNNVGLVVRYNHGILNVSGSSYTIPGSYGGNGKRNNSVSIGIVGAVIKAIQYDRNGNVIPPKKGPKLIVPMFN